MDAAATAAKASSTLSSGCSDLTSPLAAKAAVTPTPAWMVFSSDSTLCKKKVPLLLRCHPWCFFVLPCVHPYIYSMLESSLHISPSQPKPQTYHVLNPSYKNVSRILLPPRAPLKCYNTHLESNLEIWKRKIRCIGDVVVEDFTQNKKESNENLTPHT